MILPTIFLLIILTLSYYSSLAINGSIQAIVADKLGDSTAKDLGYATPNPFVHFELINFLVFVFFGFFICPVLPINPFNIKNPLRFFKIFIIYFLEVVSSMFLSFVSFLGCISFFGMSKTSSLFNYFNIYASTNLVNPHLALFDFTSFSNVTGLILIAMTYINTVMAVTIVVFNAFKYLLLVGVEKDYVYIKYSEYLVFLIPFLTLYVTFSFLYGKVFGFIFKAALFVARLIGTL